MTDHPTNRELKIMLDGMERKFDEKGTDVMQILNRIEAQTTKTNGRVTKLELWRALLFGGSIIVFAAGALFARLYIQEISRTTAQKVVETIKSNYEVNIQK